MLRPWKSHQASSLETFPVGPPIAPSNQLLQGGCQGTQLCPDREGDGHVQEGDDPCPPWLGPM